MLIAEHEVGSGWSAPRLVPTSPLTLHPACQVLHYGVCCFEGMKAFVDASGEIRLFRPDMNAARLRRSCERLALAAPEAAELEALLKRFLAADAAWIRASPARACYLRPFAFSSAPTLGVRAPTRTTLCVLAGLLPPLMSEAVPPPQTLFVETRARRAFPGGAGSHKVGGNYAPTLLPGLEAKERHGAGHVLFTVPEEIDWTVPTRDRKPPRLMASECTAMNVLFLFERKQGEDQPWNQGYEQPQGENLAGSAGPAGSPAHYLELATPPLDDCILPGVTRDSLLTMAREWARDPSTPELPLVVSERPVSIDELEARLRDGSCLEVFGCGTAYVVMPVGEVVLGDGAVRLAPKRPGFGPFSKALRTQLLDIQRGTVPSDWSVPIGTKQA